MKRRFALLALVSVGLMTTGCKMCGQGYDYCGPAFQDGYPSGGFRDRRGSILQDNSVPGTTSAEAAMPDPQPTPAAIPQGTPANLNPPPAPPR